MSLLDPKNPLSPFYRIEIKNAQQARIYNRFLIAKICVQVLILVALLALAGWSLKMFLAGLAIAGVWKGTEMLWKRKRSRCS